MSTTYRTLSVLSALRSQDRQSDLGSTLSGLPVLEDSRIMPLAVQTYNVTTGSTYRHLMRLWAHVSTPTGYATWLVRELANGFKASRMPAVLWGLAFYGIGMPRSELLSLANRTGLGAFKDALQDGLFGDYPIEYTEGCLEAIDAIYQILLDRPRLDG